jgi:hypothetical protein
MGFQDDEYGKLLQYRLIGRIIHHECYYTARGWSQARSFPDRFKFMLVAKGKRIPLEEWDKMIEVDVIERLTISGRGLVLVVQPHPDLRIGVVVTSQGQDYEVTGIEKAGKQPIGLVVKEINAMRARFTKTAGSDFMPSTEDETMALVGDGPPDDVRLSPELGGHIEQVTDHFTAPCPHCGKPVRHLKLETVYVAECDQFYWYRPKGKDHEDKDRPSG